MGRVLLILFGVVLTVFAFFDVVGTPKERMRFLPKPLWLVIIFLPYLGPILWLTFRNGLPPFLRGSGPDPRRPRGPDDDPDYLRGL